MMLCVKRFAKEVDRKDKKERAGESFNAQIKAYAGLNITEFSKLSLFLYVASYALKREILFLIFTCSCTINWQMTTHFTSSL